MEKTTTIHQPVLKTEVLDLLNIQPNDTVLDCTLGSGGHAGLIMEKLSDTEGLFIGIDQDEASLERAKENLSHYKTKKVFFCENFAHIDKLWLANQLPPINKVLLDLGWNSDQFNDATRGFSFQLEGPLDMRLSQTNKDGLRAFDLVNSLTVEQLGVILKNYGEEPYAKRIAREIVYHRKEFGPINTTNELVNIIKEAVPASYLRLKIHPATRTFQALRIAVNDELGALEQTLGKITKLLANQARIAVISFHSLEDRIVKQTFNEWKQASIGKPLTKKPVIASDKEIKANPRSRSAKLRVFIIN